MRLPSTLAPTSFERVLIPSGNAVDLPKATPIFTEWVGPSPIPTYGGKAVLSFEGEPLYAELYILRLLEACGWRGAWIDTFRRRCLRGIAEPAIIPEVVALLQAAIGARAGGEGGSFDVLAWRGDDVLFAEAKRMGRDQIRKTQARWIAAALQVGVPKESLLVIEWSTQG